MFKLLKALSLFSRIKPKRKPNISQKAASEKSAIDTATFHYPQVMKNIENFNFLDGLSTISVQQSQIKENKWIEQMKKMYQANTSDIAQRLRQKQNEIIQKLDLLEDLKHQLPTFLSLKISLLIKFRKWEQIVMDCDNSIKLVKNPSNMNESQFALLDLYNKKCICFIMNDHDNLQNFLSFKNILNTKVRRTNLDKNVEKDLGIIFYSSASQRAELIKSSQKGFEIYFDTVVLQSIGLFILGQRQLGVKRLSKLTGNNFSAKMKQQIYILIVTALSFQNKPRQKLSQKQINTISNLQHFSQKEALQISSKAFTAKQAQDSIESICQLVNKKSINKLAKDELVKYGRILCLIAQNYYLQGNKEQSLRVLKVLHKLSQAKQIKMIVTFIEMGISFDSGNLQQVISVFEEYKRSELDKSGQSAGQQFYDINSINSDLVRVNIYKLMENVYKQLNMNERIQQIKEECQAMETSLQTYMLKEPLADKQILLNKQNWRLDAQERVPYYYFDLKISKYFRPNWNQEYSIL